MYIINGTTYMYRITGFSSESLVEWKEFLWLAIPGVFVVGGEWWAFEIGSFVTGSIDGVQLAAFTITLNVISAGFVVCKNYGCVSYIYYILHYTLNTSCNIFTPQIKENRAYIYMLPLSENALMRNGGCI